MDPRRRLAMVWLGVGGLSLLVRRLAAALPAPKGRLVGTVRLGRLDSRPQPPFHVLLGDGLDARQFTDLALLTDERLITPTDQFYVRTGAPASLPAPSGWQIALGGQVAEKSALPLGRLLSESRPVGDHVLECSGNADPANFGLLSAASWQGVPITDLLRRLTPSASRAWRVRITGFDDEQHLTRTSTPGASWVFTPEELERQGAFLATHMNGVPLTTNHGAPVRLVVPNYYGCSAIKWVTRVDVVPDDEPATSQMREFAARTHQTGVPQAARDFEPPLVDLTATPVRVERWRADDGRGGETDLYRVIGIRWGGSTPRAPLTIRFRHTEPFVPVEHAPDAGHPTTWSLWSHTWRPNAPGRYQIALGVSDRSIRTRRLDLFYYTREVDIA